MGRLSGKRAVISGAASGIGRAVAQRFAAEGCTLLLLDRNKSGLEETVAGMASAADHLLAVADVSNEDEVARSIEQANAAWGGLDIVVSVAGIELIGSDACVHELDLAHWQRTIDVNLTGTFLVCKHGVRAILLGGKGGSVILTGSPTGLLGIAPDEHAYSASKAGTHGLMRAMAAGYAQSAIRVNSVIPGFIDTPINAPVMASPETVAALCQVIPMRRPGRAEEVASAYVWLASDEASYVTGAFFTADGGQTAV
jgi:NAD(P)-dependent dehydrogenase (short-subunit alcohol dehydrogenase family)